MLRNVRKSTRRLRDPATTGVGRAWTRDAEGGNDQIQCEFVPGAASLSDDLHRALPFEQLPASCRRQLIVLKRKLEKSHRDIQLFEFTIERGKVKLLKTRTPSRTTTAAAKIAVDMAKQRLIDRKTAVLRLDPSKLETLLHRRFDAGAITSEVARGSPASPGASAGKIAFCAEEAEARARDGEPIILVCSETQASDVIALHRCVGILTSTGGMTSHAAVEARGIGIPCAAGAAGMAIDPQRKRLTVAGQTFGPNDWLSLDGHSGAVYAGQVPTKPAEFSSDVETILKWADEFRTLRVRANADTPLDAKTARGFGAEGIGLCRTEHMFFDPQRIHHMRAVILATTVEARKAALGKLLPYQREGFIGIFKEMNGLPVTLRLLDPPLHEFLPHNEKDQAELARSLNISTEAVKQRVGQLKEANPMLGHRGDRLAITYPEILIMQVRAIIEAACDVKKQGIKVLPEIMIPLAATKAELDFCKKHTVETAAAVMKEKRVKVDYTFGTMIEVPRAALTADELAQTAEFFSFGTNDLTQMTFGYSRDDSGSFLPQYIQKEILVGDPFQSIDIAGVGALVAMAVEKGRSTRPDLKCGICGEHGGDPSSIEFCHAVGLNYVSCSPFRVPIARLAAAHAAIKSEGNAGSTRAVKKAKRAQ